MIMRRDRNGALTTTGHVMVVAAAALFAVQAVQLQSQAVRAVQAGRGGIRILAVQTIGARPHWDFMSGVLRALVDRGHVVTAYTPHPDGGRANYSEVDVSKGLWDDETAADATVTTATRRRRTAAAAVAISRHQCDKVYGHYRMRELLRRARPPSPDPGFDLVIAEPLMSDCASHAAAELRLPLIHVTASPVIAYIGPHVPGPAAAVSHATADHAVPNTFARRLANVVRYVVTAASVTYAEATLEYTAPRVYDSVDPVAPSLVFVNGHLVVDPARPVATNVVNVGGIHFKTAKRLPKVSNNAHGASRFIVPTLYNYGI